MCDSTWVRLFAGQRCRTPTRPKSPPSFPSPTRLVVENSYFGGGDPPKEMVGTTHLLSPRLKSARKPDYFASAVTGSDLLINNQDRVQQNPMVDQMAEALRIAIMTRPAVATLGPEFTSYVLHLVEGYEEIKKKVHELEKTLEQANALRKQDIVKFHDLAKSWDGQEMQYKAEIKRLELIIHDTSEKGVGAVVLARAGSLLRRKKLMKEDGTVAGGGDCREEVSEMAATDHQGSAADREQYSILTRRRILNPHNDIEMSERIRQLSGRTLGDNPSKPASGYQPRPTHTCPQFHPTVSTSSSSSSTFSSDLRGGDSGSSAPLMMSSETLPTASETTSPTDCKERIARTPPEDTTEPLDKVSWVNVESAVRAPISEASSTRRSHHRREFSFAPGDDSLELVRRSRAGAPISTEIEATLDLTT